MILILIIVLGGSSITLIADRAKTAPVYGVHDIILQQEAAMRYLLQGRNPYRETYFGTPVESFHYDELGQPAVNPALFHFVMPPWYLLFPFIFYFISLPILGFFDGRMALLSCLVGLLAVIYRWLKNKDLARLAIIMTALSPATVNYFLEGRSDLFALFWLMWSLYLLEKKQLIWSGIILGLACMSKQTIWFILPFYGFYLWVKAKRSITELFKALVPVGLVVGLLALPFLIWNFKAFADSVVFYLSGKAANSYPVSGYGWGMVLYQWGIIKDLHSYYPFVVWQAMISIPILILLIMRLHRKPLMSGLLISYSLFLLVFWYFSRYFNNSHIAYISSIFMLGVVKLVDEQTLSTEGQ